MNRKRIDTIASRIAGSDEIVELSKSKSKTTVHNVQKKLESLMNELFDVSSSTGKAELRKSGMTAEEFWPRWHHGHNLAIAESMIDERVNDWREQIDDVYASLRRSRKQFS